MDLHRVLQFKWHIVDGYAKTKINGKRVPMASLMMQERDGFVLDHKNRNRLDCRRQNLRWATSLQNARNRGNNSRNTSGARGVSFHVRRKKWVAHIGGLSRRRHLGCFESFEDAVAMRKIAESCEADYKVTAGNETPEVSTIVPQRSTPRKCRSGHPGVSWNPRYKKWEVKIMAQDGPKYGGRFSVLEDAVKACDNLRATCSRPASNELQPEGSR